MRSKIKICKACNVYTLKEICPVCGSDTSGVIPPKFSPEDNYGKYRRIAKSNVKEYGSH